MLPALIPILGQIGATVAASLFPDPQQAADRAKTEQSFAVALLQQSQAIEQAAAGIVKAEASSGNWLTSAWRPITMLTFVSLIVARWMGYSAPGITEAEVLKLWDIVQLGLGGYVIGRSAEKVLPGVLSALKK